MDLYQRNGRSPNGTLDTNHARKVSSNPALSARPTPKDPDGREHIAVDGFMQVIEMLETADPAFRELLLRRIQNQDPRMATHLRRTLAER